uniref:Exostosin GT47 domain-containing protein n=1 Tax=Pyrodinium bahamense TaxID=73915 RepID=A0A7S0F9Z0_9DINO|mmetsp:Transcript_15218/g.42037  ORF Transcript_15218/g.42037 Transcript_15218/m.42037 type:complete len:441 (+) Transcript_15218:37-1359(+)
MLLEKRNHPQPGLLAAMLQNLLACAVLLLACTVGTVAVSCTEETCKKLTHDDDASLLVSWQQRRERVRLEDAAKALLASAKPASASQSSLPEPLALASSASESLNTMLVSMNTYADLADIVDSSEIPVSGGDPHGIGQKAAKRLLAATTPQVVFLQRTAKSFEHFISALEDATQVPQPFVLLAVNGDGPMTHELQVRIARLRGLNACFATEMHSDAGTGVFYPMPLGMRYHHAGNYEPLLNERLGSLSAQPGHVPQAPVFTQTDSVSGVTADLIRRIVSAAPKFKDRIPKLLVAPMGNTHPVRKQYREVLSREEYKAFVDVVPESRLDLADFLTLLAKYQAVLSPPGLSYDCFRTWEVLALGSVPALHRDEEWDMDLYTKSGLDSYFLADPSMLTPESLKTFLQQMRDPKEFHYLVMGSYWQQQWRSELGKNTSEVHKLK